MADADRRTAPEDVVKARVSLRSHTQVALEGLASTAPASTTRCVDRRGEGTVRVQIRFDATLRQMATAMAIDARDAHTDAAWGPFVEEDPVFVEHVESMNRSAAMKALRECLWAYGHLSWPDDYPVAAGRAARARVDEWYRPPPRRLTRPPCTPGGAVQFARVAQPQQPADSPTAAHMLQGMLTRHAVPAVEPRGCAQIRRAQRASR